jgi:hypothetical protein
MAINNTLVFLSAIGRVSRFPPPLAYMVTRIEDRVLKASTLNYVPQCLLYPHLEKVD